MNRRYGRRITQVICASRTEIYIGLRLVSQRSVANKSFFSLFVSPFPILYITSYPDVCFWKTKEWFERMVFSEETMVFFTRRLKQCSTSETWQNKLRSLIRWFHLSVETSILLQKSLSLLYFSLTKGSIDFVAASSGFLRITLWAIWLFSFIRYFQFYTCNICLPSLPWMYDPYTQCTGVLISP